MPTAMADCNTIVKVVKRRRAEIIAFLLILEKWRKQKRLNKPSRLKNRSWLLRHNQQNNIATTSSSDPAPLLTTDAHEGISSSIQHDTARPEISASSNPDVSQNNSTFIKPGPISPTLSTSTCSKSDVPQRRFGRRNRHNSAEDDFCEVINDLAKLSRQPIAIRKVNTNDTGCSSENVLSNGFITFIGSILQSFKDEELKLEVMSTITQSLINARILDLKRTKIVDYITSE